MIKKLLVAAAAAGALSVPLAGLAAADPSPTNPGVPGAPGLNGNSPGSFVKDYNQAGAPAGPVGKILGPANGFSDFGQNH